MGDESGYFDQRVVDHLAHFGVKGMKWGVRKTRAAKTQLSSAKTVQPFTLKNGTKFSIESIDISPGKAKLLNKVLPERVIKSLNKTTKFDIKDNAGKIIGDVSLTRWNDNEMYFSNIGVHPDSRGQGIATSLVVAGVKVAKEQNFKKITLAVPTTALDAQHIYKKIGFEFTGENLLGIEALPMMELDVTKLKQSQMDDVDNFLAHYGVKGMKWGVRRAASKGRGAAASAFKGYRRVEKALSPGQATINKGARKVAGAAVGKVFSENTKSKRPSLNVSGKAIAKTYNTLQVGKPGPGVTKAAASSVYKTAQVGKAAPKVSKKIGEVYSNAAAREKTRNQKTDKLIIDGAKAVGRGASKGAGAAKAGVTKLAAKKPVQPGSPEHETVQAILKKGGAKNLTNAEIQAVNTRLQLTQSFNTLTAQKSTLSKGNKIVKDILDVVSTADRVYKTTSGPTAQALKKAANK